MTSPRPLALLPESERWASEYLVRARQLSYKSVFAQHRCHKPPNIWSDAGANPKALHTVLFNQSSPQRDLGAENLDVQESVVPFPVKAKNIGIDGSGKD